MLQARQRLAVPPIGRWLLACIRPGPAGGDGHCAGLQLDEAWLLLWRAVLRATTCSRLQLPPLLFQLARCTPTPPSCPAPLPQKLKAAGFGAGDKLESAWQQHFGKETGSVGQVQFIPRQT